MEMLMPFRHFTASRLIACLLVFIFTGGPLGADTREDRLTAATPLVANTDVTPESPLVDSSGVTVGSPTAMIGTLLRLIAALAVVLVAFWVCARLMRRLDTFGRQRAQHGLRIVATLPIGQRERVLVVQAGDEQILLGVTAQAIERLHVLEKPLSTTGSVKLDEKTVPDDGQEFRTRLKAAMQRRVGVS